LTGKVIKERYRSKKVAEAMTPLAELFTLPERQVAADPIREADKFFTENIGIHKLLIVDEKGLLKGLITLSDIEKITSEVTAARRAARDSDFRLVCAAAISILRRSNGELDRNRILAHVAELVAENVDAVAVSTAHGHSAGVGEMVKLIRGEFRDLTIIAGNVTSGAGVEYLAECGASAIKIGQGPGSICTTRIVAGVGIPQLTALHVASLGAKAKGVRLIADGGITKSGDIVKALTIADAVICGGLLAGCREAPGELIEISGKLYKQYRGMGSLSAMKQGSAARYGHDKEDKSRKLTAEGIEALKEVSGSVDTVLADLIGGIRSGMGYLGAATLPELRSKARYVRVSPAGQREAAPHDVIEVATRKEN
jgi:IMP dehydrogenase